MLRSLSIRDFTIIDRLELDFEPGFGAITGETGAGKSILIDALAQLLGERGDSTLVAEGATQADLSASFELASDHPAHDWLRAQSIDVEEAIVLLRRVIPADGASRAWINGQPATIGQLRELGRLLVEIHGQNEHQRLAQASHQRRLLDRRIERSVPDAVADAATAHASAQQALEALLAEAGSAAERELIEFQLRELERLGLAEGELEQLETEQRRLASIDELQRGVGIALEALSGDEGSADQLVHRALRALEPLIDRAPELAETGDMLATAAVNLEEAARNVQRLQDTLEHDPARLAEVEQRLARALELARKHRIEPNALPSHTAALRARLERISRFDEERARLQKAVDAAEAAWRAAALRLNAHRRKAGDALAGAIEAALAELGMNESRVRFEIEHDADAAVAEHGADRIEILFSANPGQSLRPLARIASGGELSRFSLALIIASGDSGRGLVRIFDEIDAGVGGETAHAVGRFLRRAGAEGQAFCVTHLAQVAACADAQWKVVKHAVDGRTRVVLEALDASARVGELARMLGASESESARRHAEILLAEGRG